MVPHILDPAILQSCYGPFVSVADIGKEPGGSGPPFAIFWVKKEEMTEGRKAGSERKSKLTILIFFLEI